MKAFIYLDEYKMYSLSSQLFEGLSEYVVSSETKTFEDSENQKGNIGSGRIMANIIRSERSKLEKKFLHDYSYTLFEKTLNEHGKILKLNNENADNNLGKLSHFDFVKIEGRAIFNDMKKIYSTIEDFNSFALATFFFKHKQTIKAEKVADSQINQIKDRNKKAKLKNSLSKNNLEKELLKKGTLLDDDSKKSYLKIIEYAYKDQFLVQFPLRLNESSVLFSSIINREYLRESEDFLISKYSRETEKKFSILGLVTQEKGIGKNSQLNEFLNNTDIDKESVSESKSKIKYSFMKMINAIMNLENVYRGPLKDEYIIDPISIYREL